MLIHLRDLIRKRRFFERSHDLNDERLAADCQMIEKIGRDHLAIVRGREPHLDPIVELAILGRNGGALTVYAASHLLGLGADRCSSGCSHAQGTDGTEHVAAAPRADYPLVGNNSHATHRGRRKRHRDRRGAHPVAACDGRRQ